MAIQFKTEEQRKIEKQAKAPKNKLQKAHKIFFIASIVSFAILLLYFIVCFNPMLVIMPLAIFWILAMTVPTALSIGFVWFSDGFKNFAKDLTDLLGRAFSSVGEVIVALEKSLPYVGSVLLAIIATYGVLSFLNYRKNKEEKKYFYHFIAACALFILSLLFVILSLVLYKRLYQ